MFSGAADIGQTVDTEGFLWYNHSNHSAQKGGSGIKKEVVWKLRDHGEWARPAAVWFHQKWGIPEETYAQSIRACLERRGPVPQWYFIAGQGRILAGAGVIENDFHNRTDLTPNVCALYVEESCRGRGLAGKLLRAACEDMSALGIDTLYLLTDHTGFYERHGWSFLCMVQGDGEPEFSRMYRHQAGKWGAFTLCPYCGEYGRVLPAQIKSTGERIGICEECDTVWTEGEPIVDGTGQSSRAFAEGRRTPAFWMDLEYLEVSAGPGKDGM